MSPPHSIQTSRYSGIDDGLLANRKCLISFDLNFNLTDGPGEGGNMVAYAAIIGFIYQGKLCGWCKRQMAKEMNESVEKKTLRL